MMMVGAPSTTTAIKWWKKMEKSTLISLGRFLLEGRRAFGGKIVFSFRPMLAPTLFRGHIITDHFFIFQLPPAKKIRLKLKDDAPAGICGCAVYRSFNNLQAFKLTQ